ncbi:transcriptional regulator [Terrilactibacillus laevilacticus]|uniref:Transcriptional regulator n=1 Tax=Terrilactibacillus laevilacticus TaxID=1380157 RepID=A0ABW5PSJ4_9BACI|nr:transcriptional regulator [Terrilactibacillus laevilacticus]
MIEIKCPHCEVVGKEHIVSTESVEKSKNGDPWFHIAYCDKCGHVYGTFTKTVKRPTQNLYPIF